MIRLATEADVPQILAIYAPYVETTTITFEYSGEFEDIHRQNEFFTLLGVKK